MNYAVRFYVCKIFLEPSLAIYPLHIGSGREDFPMIFQDMSFVASRFAGPRIVLEILNSIEDAYAGIPAEHEESLIRAAPSWLNKQTHVYYTEDLTLAITKERVTVHNNHSSLERRSYRTDFFKLVLEHWLEFLKEEVKFDENRPTHQKDILLYQSLSKSFREEHGPVGRKQFIREVAITVENLLPDPRRRRRGSKQAASKPI